jgi:hypothetical protein
MKAKLLVLTTLLFSLCGGVSAQDAQTKSRSTITLLPAKESSAGSDSLLWVQNNPPQDTYLQFDLSSLPGGLTQSDFVRCTLRLVAQKVAYVPADNPDSGGQLVIVKGQTANNDFTRVAKTPDLVSLSTLLDTQTKKNNVALQATATLCAAVYRQYAGDKLISLRLYSDSHKASSLFYSTKEFAGNATHKPRLVIEYNIAQPGLLETASWPQHQQNPEHTGRSPWIPFKPPDGFSLVSIALPNIGGNAGSVADFPLIYWGNIYLIEKVLEQNYLLSLDLKGREGWQRAIGTGTVQRSPVISPNGILYVVTENQIADYDLNKSGERYGESYPLAGAKLSAYSGLTLGNDGSLFLAVTENDLNYIYGFTPSLTPFLKSGPFGGGQEKVSTVTVSQDGEKIFAQTPKGAVVIDIANPSDQRTITLANDKDQPWEYYYVPVAGSAGNIMIFSDFTSRANKGNKWDYSETQRVWNASGSLLPQPVLGSNGIVYYIQGGVLHGHRYDKMGSADINSGTALNTTSNLVMDGANNIYFWDNGYFYGYSPDAKPLFERVDLTNKGLEGQRPAEPEAVSAEKKAEREGGGPEQFIRLMMAPDGTLWANNKNGRNLFAFKPKYASTNLPLQQQDIRNHTTYRANGEITVGGVTVSGGTQLFLQAEDGIAFAKGFTVEKGASVLAGTGF